jgi:hypothetical protein
MNVSVKSSGGDGKQVAHKIVVVDKDFAKGDIIYKVASDSSGSRLLIGVDIGLNRKTRS